MLQNTCILNKCCSFDLYIHQRIMKKKMCHGFHKNMQLNGFQHW